MHGFVVVENLTNTFIYLISNNHFIMNFFHMFQENKYNHFNNIERNFHAYQKLFIYPIRKNKCACLGQNVCIFQNKFLYI